MDARGPATSSDELNCLYQEAAPAVYAWVGLRLGPKLRLELDPEDVLQEVACRAFARRETFDPARGPFRAWIFGVARHLLLSSMEQLTGYGRADREWLTTGGLAAVPE